MTFATHRAAYRLEIEPRTGGSFVVRLPDGRVNVRGEVVEWLPPRRLVTTWTVEWIPELRELPPCFVSYDVELSGESVKLTLTKAYCWDAPDALLAGGPIGLAGHPVQPQERVGTGKPLLVKLEPPEEIMDAVSQVVAAKPWLRR